MCRAGVLILIGREDTWLSCDWLNPGVLHSHKREGAAQSLSTTSSSLSSSPSSSPSLSSSLDDVAPAPAPPTTRRLLACVWCPPPRCPTFPAAI
eukprot:CAMPEP_0181358776 /NCGR_PEP_ID=MMETSP1106-20121128/5709_1 /TAXON_ID=81844 /ORGANISM="Mantoniella antarctica, Strain SL-175" /LENGTH=93 /DNA_ID=CAMNT_0023471797 /DNA_START=177 /DNA_END=458 /DNA_ORIENTATION=-